jgi:hypothetical protein
MQVKDLGVGSVFKWSPNDDNCVVVDITDEGKLFHIVFRYEDENTKKGSRVRGNLDVY